MKAMPFKEWFSKILPCLENNSVIVLNNASYHPCKQEKMQAQPEIKK
jgi:predicted O-methyltransferase YrrM